MNSFKRYPLILFFLLAYLFVWLEALFPNPILAILSVASPTLAAVLTLRFLKEKDAPDLMQPLFQGRASLFWYGVAILGPILFGVTAIFILSLQSSLPPDFWRVVPWTTLPAILFGRLLINVWEEVGWRGFALPRLQARSNSLTASLILGFLWGFWHLPFYIGEASQQTQLPFALLLLDTVLISILYTWLYNNTKGSLLFVTLFHAVGNSFNLLVIGAGVPLISYFGTHLIIILVVDILVIALFGKSLTRRPKQESLPRFKQELKRPT